MDQKPTVWKLSTRYKRFDLLTFTACLSWLTGSLPVLKPLPHSNYFAFKWLSFASIYTGFIIIFVSLLSMDVMWNKTDLYFDQVSQAMHVAIVGCLAMDFLLPLVTRAVGLFYCSKLSGAIRDLLNLGKLHMSPSHNRMWSKYFVYAVLVLQSALRMRYCIRFVSYYLDPTLSQGSVAISQQLFTGAWTPLVTICGAIGLLNAAICELIIMWLISCIGIRLKIAHEAVFHMISDGIKRDGSHQSGTDDKFVVMYLFENFKKLKAGFGVCGQVLGVYMLVMIVWSLANVTFIIHLVIWPRPSVMTGADMLQSFIQLSVLVYLGQSLQSQVEDTRDEIKELVVASKLTYHGPGESKFLELATHASDWKWEINAGGFFVVDLSCVPSLLGALATYTIFMVQLELSDQATLNAGPGCSNSTGLPIGNSTSLM